MKTNLLSAKSIFYRNLHLFFVSSFWKNNEHERCSLLQTNGAQRSSTWRGTLLNDWGFKSRPPYLGHCTIVLLNAETLNAYVHLGTKLLTNFLYMLWLINRRSKCIFWFQPTQLERFVISPTLQVVDFDIEQRALLQLKNKKGKNTKIPNLPNINKIAIPR